ncbi:similar to Saccharomyces cerevisiae YCL033C MXR2 Methionine-R-sulfoxide reductase, involved in the response to oxidative stress [Geotrichum candidum]|uniref:Peptide-methionine (R)-S-oxide reductase n=2 Tax=Geotrichum candidum TaxID=1173061 RepID=A0A0J9X9V3_GEOCN|nr:similar to Saccharomyces cerevisiae YCL033C MXR2 Methionine-R-sulfoxide reductase, involved in the response to oxidative stress [Geotrichum candidum]
MFRHSSVRLLRLHTLKLSNPIYKTAQLHTSTFRMSNNNTNEPYPVSKSELEWRVQLSPEQYRVLRQKGTERPGSGEYNHFSGTGVYNCAACDTPLYKSDAKFDSGCGWPAFYEAIPGAIRIFEDKSGGMVRTEMVCNNCGGHLGHVFKGEGFKTPTDERHCVNSVSLKFVGNEDKKL